MRFQISVPISARDFFVLVVAATLVHFVIPVAQPLPQLDFVRLKLVFLRRALAQLQGGAAAPCPADALVCEEVMRKMFVSAF